MGYSDVSNVEGAIFAIGGSKPEDARISLPATRELSQRVFAALGEPIPSWCSPALRLEVSNDGSLRLTGNRHSLQYSLGNDDKVAKYNYRDEISMFERDLVSGVTPQEFDAAIKAVEEAARKKSI